MNKENNFVKFRKSIGWSIVGILILIGLVNLFYNFTKYPSQKVNLETIKDEKIGLGSLSKNGIVTESVTNRFSATEQLVVILKNGDLSKKGKILLEGPNESNYEFDFNLTNTEKTDQDKIFLPQLSESGKYLLTYIEATNERHMIDFSIVDKQ